MKLNPSTKIVFGILAVLVIAAAVFIGVAYSKQKKSPAPVSQTPTPAPAPTPPTPTPPTEQATMGVDTPVSNGLIHSPVKVSGKASGNWFFEGSFPVSVLDADGTVLGKAPMKALGDWMQSGSVNFSGSITFTKPKGLTGNLLFENDNPSGLPENHREFKIPVKFK